jgi:non-ribosomal peptide synthetase component F
MPFEQIVQTLNISRSASYSPLFQIMLSSEQAIESGFDKRPEGQNKKPKVNLTKSKFDLSMTHTVKGDRHHISWCYNTDLFDLATIELMSTCFNHLMKQLVAAPQHSLSEFSLTGLNTMGQAAPTPIPARPIPTRPVQSEPVQTKAMQIKQTSKASVHHMLQHQASISPDNIALDFAGKQTRFKALNADANRLAHYLGASLIAGGQSVVVCMDSSDLLATAVFAVLKSGCSYIAVDKSLPQKRIETIIEKTNASMVLCDEPMAFDFSNRK